MRTSEVDTAEKDRERLTKRLTDFEAIERTQRSVLRSAGSPSAVSESGNYQDFVASTNSESSGRLSNSAMSGVRPSW